MANVDKTIQKIGGDLTQHSVWL